jgi:DNA-binding FadR family transcriptional regulator
LAAERIDVLGIQNLRDAIVSLQESPTVEAQVDADVRFHRILAEASGNPLFVYLLDAMAELLRASRVETIGHGGVEPALRGHQAILTAIENRRPAAARQAMGDHVRASMQDLQKVLDRTCAATSRSPGGAV